VVPLTTNVERVYPSESLVTVNKNRGKAMADQIATVSKRRLVNREGRLSGEDLAGVEHAIAIQLQLVEPPR
jgi:mRNA interferase MazF